MGKYITTTHKVVKDEPLYVGILASTVGYRQKAYGVRILTQVGDSTVSELQLSALRNSCPNAKISLVAGFQADKVIRNRAFNVSILENQLYLDTSSGEEIRLLLNSINPSRLLLVDGAIVFDYQCINRLTESSSVFVYENEDDSEVGMQIEDGFVTHFSYGLTNKFSGLVYLEGEILESLKKMINRNHSKLLLFELLNMLINNKQTLKVVGSNKTRLVRF